ncbi:hypothetical protein NFI96_027384 [Prochilodus magdalenae]|nr:hypothetical protein NFI96_027384 [Prochilodus magdalenae]
MTRFLHRRPCPERWAPLTGVPLGALLKGTPVVPVISGNRINNPPTTRMLHTTHSRLQAVLSTGYIKHNITVFSSEMRHSLLKEDEGDDCGLQKGQTCPPPPACWRVCGGSGLQLQVLGCSPEQQPHLEQQHFQSGQEGTSAALLPQAVEASWAREPGPHLLLQMCGGERPMIRHQRVARKLLCCRQESSAEGGEGCTEPAWRGTLGCPGEGLWAAWRGTLGCPGEGLWAAGERDSGLPGRGTLGCVERDSGLRGRGALGCPGEGLWAAGERDSGLPGRGTLGCGAEGFCAAGERGSGLPGRGALGCAEALCLVLAGSLTLVCFTAGFAAAANGELVKAKLGESPSFSFSLPDAAGVKQVTWQRLGHDDSVHTMATYSENFRHQVTEQYQGKVELTLATLNATTIVIKNVTFADEGCYVCTFNVYPSGTERRKACLSVQGLLAVKTSKLSHKSTEVVVSCSATGKPQPEVRWTPSDLNPNSTVTKNGDGTSTTTSILTVTLSGDRGNSVECVAESGGVIQREHVSLREDQSQPDPEDRAASRHYVGFFVVLICVISGICIGIILHRKKLKGCQVVAGSSFPVFSSSSGIDPRRLGSAPLEVSSSLKGVFPRHCCLWLAQGSTAAVPDSDAGREDALYGASVEAGEDVRRQTKHPEPSQEEEAGQISLLCWYGVTM